MSQNTKFSSICDLFSQHFLIFLDQANCPTAPRVLLVTTVDLSIVIINFVITRSVIIVQSLSTSFYRFDIFSRSTSSTQPTPKDSSEEKSQFSKRWVPDHHLSWYRCVGLDDRRGRSKSGLLGLCGLLLCTCVNISDLNIRLDRTSTRRSGIRWTWTGRTTPSAIGSRSPTGRINSPLSSFKNKLWPFLLLPHNQLSVYCTRVSGTKILE